MRTFLWPFRMSLEAAARPAAPAPMMMTRLDVIFASTMAERGTKPTSKTAFVCYFGFLTGKTNCGLF